MLANILIGAGIAVLFILAVRHILRQHKEGGCCGSCRGCHGCSRGDVSCGKEPLTGSGHKMEQEEK